MLVEEAEERIARAIAPVSIDAFLNGILDRRFLHVDSDPSGQRARILGDDPANVLLNDFRRLSQAFGSHAENATAPPPSRRNATDAADFERLIGEFHDRGYTVRLDEVERLSSELAYFTRAVEVQFMTSARARVFWSRAGAHAPIHHDDRDLFVIHLVGRKQWTISTDASDLPNTWAPQSGTEALLTNSATVLVKPGDLLYIPRGTPHRVEALDDTLHVSISFSPLTVREALIACLDLASDMSRPLREGVGGRAGAQALSGDFGALPARLPEVAQVLVRYCEIPGFVAEALRRRAGRLVRDMHPDAPPAVPREPITPTTYVQRRSFAACQLSRHDARTEIAFPGGRELVHAAMQPALEFIARTKSFAVRDLPGPGDDAIRVALVQKLVADGLLEPASPPGPSSGS